jgi:hypothetical protein
MLAISAVVMVVMLGLLGVSHKDVSYAPTFLRLAKTLLDNLYQNGALTIVTRHRPYRRAITPQRDPTIYPHGVPRYPP